VKQSDTFPANLIAEYFHTTLKNLAVFSVSLAASYLKDRLGTLLAFLVTRYVAVPFVTHRYSLRARYSELEYTNAVTSRYIKKVTRYLSCLLHF